MKKFPALLVLLSAMTLIGCSSNEHQNITGSFASFGKSEYSIAYDTLIITKLDNNNCFQIEERIGYQRVINKQLKGKQYRIQKWQGTWNPNTCVLAETEYGRQLYFNTNNNSIRIKNSAFIRFK